MTHPRSYAVYGVAIASDHAFEIPVPTTTPPRPDLTLRLVVEPEAWVESPEGWTELFRGTAAFDDGRPMFLVMKRADELLVRFAEVADFHLVGNTVHATVYGEEYLPAVEIYFLGTVLSIWLELRGAIVLHGAAVESGGRAAILLGDKGAGKTTLTCGMLREGHGLIADDLTVVHPGPSPTIPAAYPRLRMWPEQAETLLGMSNLERVLPGDTKRWAPLPDPATFVEGGAPLAGFYALSRSSVPAPTHFTRLSGGESVLCLLQNSFVPNVAQSLGLAPERLRRMSELASRFPVFTLAYGSDLDDLDRVCGALADHVEELQAPAPTPSG